MDVSDGNLKARFCFLYYDQSLYFIDNIHPAMRSFSQDNKVCIGVSYINIWRVLSQNKLSAIFFLF